MAVYGAGGGWQHKTLQMAASRGPAAAAGGACEPREAVPFDKWASVQRRRAALDGACIGYCRAP